MKTNLAIAFIIILSITVTSATTAQTIKPYMDSISRIMADELIPPYALDGKPKTVFGFILVPLTKSLKVQKLQHSNTLRLGPDLNTGLERAQRRLAKLNWVPLFPAAERRSINYILIPVLFGTDEKYDERITSAELWKQFSQALELMPLQRSASVVMSEPVKFQKLKHFVDE